MIGGLWRWCQRSRKLRNCIRMRCVWITRVARTNWRISSSKSFDFQMLLFVYAFVSWLDLLGIKSNLTKDYPYCVKLNMWPDQSCYISCFLLKKYRTKLLKFSSKFLPTLCHPIMNIFSQLTNIQLIRTSCSVTPFFSSSLPILLLPSHVQTINKRFQLREETQYLRGTEIHHRIYTKNIYQRRSNHHPLR